MILNTIERIYNLRVVSLKIACIIDTNRYRFR